MSSLGQLHIHDDSSLDSIEVSTSIVPLKKSVSFDLSHYGIEAPPAVPQSASYNDSYVPHHNVQTYPKYNYYNDYVSELSGDEEMPFDEMCSRKAKRNVRNTNHINSQKMPTQQLYLENVPSDPGEREISPVSIIPEDPAPRFYSKPKPRSQRMKSAFQYKPRQEVPQALPPRSPLVIASGHVLVRASPFNIFFKIWKQRYWVYCKPAKVLFFKTREDSQEWLTGTNLSPEQRRKLLKLAIDFDLEGKLYKKMYEVAGGQGQNEESLLKTSDLARPKGGRMKYELGDFYEKQYKRNGPYLNTFKLEKWTDVGNSTIAKFASRESADTKALRKVIRKCIKKTQQSGSKKKRRRRKRSLSYGTDSDGSIASVSTLGSNCSRDSCSSYDSMSSAGSYMSQSSYGSYRSTGSTNSRRRRRRRHR